MSLTMTTTTTILTITCLLSTLTEAVPKKYNPDDEFQPSSNLRYYESSLPNNKNVSASSKLDKESRFGIPISSYGHSGSGVSNYPSSSGVGYTHPYKIDIGGVAIGALLGLGAILLLPKLAHVFSGGHGYRSLGNELPNSVTDILARVDNSLEKHNIDSSSCMQRVICSYVRDAKKNMENGEAGTLDEIVYTLTNNPLFSFMLDGSAIKQAVDMASSDNPEKCDTLYMKCPVGKDNFAQIAASLLPS